jgi:cell division septal protein FtsQ
MIKVINRKKNSQGAFALRGKKKFSGKWLYRSVALFFAVTVIFTLFFSDYLKITEMRISGLEKLDEVSVRSVIGEELGSRYFNLVSRNNLILLQKSELQEVLLNNFKRIEAVSIEKFFPGSLRVTIKERRLTMLLCSSGKCYVLNEKGDAYAAENFTQDELEKENLIILTDLSNARISTENSPLESDFQDFVLGLDRRVLEDAGIVLKKQYETPSRMSGDLKAETEEGWKIYFSESVGMEKEVLMLKTVIVNKIEKEHQKDLEYVDLRIANKVFYKFKEGTVQTQDVESVPAPEVKKDEKKKKK